MVSIDDFLRTHPDALLADYKKYCQDLENSEQERRVDIEHKYKQWIKERDGEYFLVNFNQSSRVLFKFCVDKTYSGLRTLACLALAFYRGADATYIKKERREMNYLWLNDLNPYYPEYKKLFGTWNKSGVISITPISQEMADALFMQFSGTIDPFIDEIIQKEKTMLDTGTIVKS
jgi:hypothetical protein